MNLSISSALISTNMSGKQVLAWILNEGVDHRAIIQKGNISLGFLPAIAVDSWYSQGISGNLTG